MKKYRILNLILISVNLVLLLGIVWVFVKYIDYTEVIEYTENIEVDEESTEMIENTDYIEAQDYTEVIENIIDEENSNITIPPQDGTTATGGVEQYNNEVATSSEIKTEETAESMPSKINLSVPFTSQAPEKNWDQPWQDACEEAAVLMLDAYYKGYGLSPLFSKDEILKMVAWEEARSWGMSISSDQVKELGEWYVGKIKQNNRTTEQHLRIVVDPTVEEIKKFIASGDPVLVLAYGKDLPNPHFSNGGPEYHALIIRGYDDEMGEFITNDPGTQFGENFRYKYNDLMGAIHDWNGGDVKSGRSVVLVIE